MTWELVKEVLPELIGLGGLAVAFVSVFRVTTVRLQEALHAKQVEQCVELVQTLGVSQDRLFSIASRAASASGEENAEQLHGLFAQQVTRMLYWMERMAVIAPDAVMECLAKYKQLVTSCHESGTDFAQRFRSGDDVVAAFDAVVRAARAALGIEPLGERTDRLLQSVRQD